MKTNWKRYSSEKGAESLVNITLPQQSYYRMKLVLKSHFEERYEERIEKSRSFLYDLVMNLQGREEEKSEQEKKETEAFEFYIDAHKLILFWNEKMGLVISSETKEGNAVIEELEQILKKEKLKL